MGDVDYFFGTSFTWTCHDNDHVSVHLTQTAFTEFCAHRFGVDRMNRVPNMTPYRSGIRIGSIPSPDPSDPDLPVETKYINVSLAPSIILSHALGRTYPWLSPSWPLTATIQATNTSKGKDESCGKVHVEGGWTPCRA